MRKVVRLTESDLVRVVKRTINELDKKRPAKRIGEKEDNLNIFDVLENTKLYKLLDNITKVRNFYGDIRNENSGGGLRLLVYNNDGKVIYNLSINGYNQDKTINLLLDLIESNYLNGDILKELKSIERKTSDRISNLIRRIISLIIWREPIQDTVEEMIDRWFNNDYIYECRLIKQASDEVIEEMKKRYSNEIAWHYNLGFPSELDEFKEIISKKFDDCRK